MTQVQSTFKYTREYYIIDTMIKYIKEKSRVSEKPEIARIYYCFCVMFGVSNIYNNETTQKPLNTIYMYVY